LAAEEAARRAANGLADERARHLCTVEGWCVADGQLPYSELRGVFASSERDLWAVGSGGTVLHFNGRDWGGWLGLGDSARLDDVIAFGPRDVWAVGSGPRVLHWDGHDWQEEKVPEIPSTDNSWWGRWRLVGSSPDDLWIHGESRQLLRRTGGHWVAVPTVSESVEPKLVQFSSGELWLFHDGVLRWDGLRFERLDQDPQRGLKDLRYPRAVARLGDGSVAACSSEVYIVRDGKMVTTLPRPPVASCNAVAGSSAQDVWVLGTLPGELKHWDGAAWHHLDGHNYLRAVVSLGPGRAVVVGDRTERRLYLPNPVVTQADGTEQRWQLALGKSRGATREVCTLGARKLLSCFWDGAWHSEEIPELRSGPLDFQANDRGAMAILAGSRNFLLRGSTETAFREVKPPEGDWVAMARGTDSRGPVLLSREGALMRWQYQWEQLRAPDPGDKTSYRGLAYFPIDNPYLEGIDTTAGISRPFVVDGAVALHSRRYPSQAQLDSCAAPRGSLRQLDDRVYAVSGTSARPCLMQLVDYQWTAVALQGYSEHPFVDSIANLEELLVLDLPEGNGERSLLAGRLTDGWHLYRAPLGRITDAVVQPGTHRAFLIGSSFGAQSTLLDFDFNEPWRFVVPSHEAGKLPDDSATRSAPLGTPEASSPVATSTVTTAPAASAMTEPTASTTAEVAPSAKGATPPAVEPEHGAAWKAAIAKGRAATGRRDYPAAIAAFSEALSAEPGDARALAERGYARLLSGDNAGAEADLSAAAQGTAVPALLQAIEHNRALARQGGAIP